MLKKLAKSIFAVLLVFCSITMVACGKEKNPGEPQNPNPGLDATQIEKVELLTQIPTSFFVGDSLDISEAKIKVTYKNQTSEEITITSEMITTAFDSSSAGEKQLVITYREKIISVPYTVVAVEATNIALKSGFKKNYFVGDQINLDGGVVTMTYNNQTTADVSLTTAHISNFDTTTAGTGKKLKITVEGKELEFEYNVEEVKLSSIALKNSFKTDYYVGDTLDVSGGKITLTYNNGISEDINVSAAMVSGFDSTESKSLMLTITYEGKTITNIACTVRAVELTGAALKSPIKTTYYIGDTLDVSGGKITLTYNSGKTEDIDVTAAMVSGFQSQTATESRLQIKYLSYIFNLDYTVTDVVATSITLSSPFKTAYFVGEQIDISEGKLTIAYNNGAIDENIPVSISMISDFNTTTAGSFTLKIEHKKLSITVDYTVTAIVATGLSVKSPFKTTYYNGETLDVSGGKLAVTYNNGTSETITLTKQMVKNFKKNSVGTKTMQITYGGFTIDQEYTILYLSFAIHTPFKQTYSVGEALDVSGGKLAVYYEEGGEATLVDITADMVSGFNSTSPIDVKQLDITYLGVKIAGLISIEVVE